MALNVICWLWGQKYSRQDVLRLQRALQRHLVRPFRFCAFAEQPLLLPGVDCFPIEDRSLATRSCFCRLRMFDADWQARHNFNEPILSLDLDLVITGKIDPLVDTESTFKILKGANAANPCPFNGSVMLLKPGHHHEVWNDFSLDKAATIPHYEFPDDQGWIWHKLPNADGWNVGRESGIYGFQKPGWPMGKYSVALPPDARIVSFIGKRKPSMYKDLPWIKKYWTDLAA